MTLKIENFDFYDFGCSKGSSIKFGVDVLGGRRGLGIDIDKRKVESSIKAGIALGIERYKYLYNKKNGVIDEIYFSKEKFFDFSSVETNVARGKYAKHYQMIFNKWNQNELRYAMLSVTRNSWNEIVRELKWVKEDDFKNRKL